MSSLERVDRTLLRDHALTRIREAIVGGELPAGAVVKDTQLAARLGLSVAPVRSALARLGDEGLIESKPQSRTRVTQLLGARVHDAAVVVRAMHELAASQAVPELTDDDLQLMRTANARFADAVAAGDLDTALAADDTLHDVLVDRCANTAVRATLDRFTPTIRRLERQRFAAAHGRASVQLHEQLIAACAAKDVDAAVATTHEIWTSLLEELDALTRPTRPEETL